MSITLELAPDVESELREEARCLGITAEQLLADVVTYQIFLDHRDGIGIMPSFDTKTAVICRRRRNKVSLISFATPGFSTEYSQETAD